MFQFRVKIILAASMLLGSSKSVVSTGIGDIQTVVNFANDAWGVLNGDLPVSALLTGSTGVMLDKIMAAVERLDEQVDQLSDTLMRNSEKIDDMTELLEQMLVKLPLRDKVDKSMRRLHSYMERVDYLYDNLQRLTDSGKNFTSTTLLRFIECVISHDAGDLVDVLTKMHRLFIPGRSATYKDSLFYLLSEDIKGNEDTECSRGMSSQASIYEIYKSVEVTEMRAFIMTMASYSLLTIYGNASYSGELGLAKNDFIKRSNEYVSAAQLTLETVSRIIHLCDIGPMNYKRGVTYTTFRTSYNMRSPAGHTLSMAPRRSNYRENMVVTGVRFIEDNGIIFYQVKEAKLLPRGRVDPTTERWVSFPSYELREVDSEFQFYYAGTNEIVSSEFYHVITKNNRSFDTDDILLPPNHVLTGIDFELKADGDIGLEIMSTKFDYETGKLKPETADWWKYKHGISWISTIDRMKIELDGRRKDPSKIKEPQKIGLYPKYWFNFEVEDDDAEANLVPIFDARPVSGKPSVPLSGLGLYHRGSKNTAGLINFRLFSLDLSLYMKHDSEE